MSFYYFVLLWEESVNYFLLLLYISLMAWRVYRVWTTVKLDAQQKKMRSTDHEDPETAAR